MPTSTSLPPKKRLSLTKSDNNDSAPASKRRGPFLYKMTVPTHIAIIMDGNGRWATRQGMPRFKGHVQGYKNLRNILKAASDMGVKYLTVYAFSSENFKRPKAEVDFLMSLFAEAAAAELDSLKEENVKVVASGRIDELPAKVRKMFIRDIEETAGNTGIVFNIAVNYGGRNEIVDAARKIAEKAAKGEIKPEDIDEDALSGCMYHPEIPDPDLVIRTSGEIRVSNFLLWEIAYSEFYITDILWPDFNEDELKKAIAAFGGRKRRFGKVSDDE